MGVPFQGTPDYFENLGSEHEYAILAQAQTDWLHRNISEKDKVKTIIERLIKK